MNNLGNKYYQFIANLDEFNARCSDTGDSDLLMAEEMNDCEEVLQENLEMDLHSLVEEETLNDTVSQVNDDISDKKRMTMSRKMPLKNGK